jgi:peroxiredoxin
MGSVKLATMSNASLINSPFRNLIMLSQTSNLARQFLLGLFTALAIGAFATRAVAKDDGPPAVGDAAQDFELSTLDGDKIKLSTLNKEGPVVLLVMRGYPGYQCPICAKQMAEFVASAAPLAEANARVLLVYPGEAKDLEKRAAEFLRGKKLPKNFVFVTDPDYTFGNAYHLRWEAKNETVYPATFVIDAKGIVRFAKISKTHGGRASVDEVKKAL